MIRNLEMGIDMSKRWRAESEDGGKQGLALFDKF